MNNWPTKKLSDILETCDAGVWGKPAMSGKGLFVLRSTNMTNDGHLDFSDVAERKIEGDIKKVKLSDGDILVEKSGGGPDQPVGRVAHFTAPNDRAYSFANFIQRLRVKSKLIDSRFLFYCLLFLHKIGFTKKLQSQTTGIKNLKLSLYLKTEIPVPPLATQKQIVARLDKIAEAQKLNDELIQKSDELFQSLLHRELNPAGKNWEAKELGEIALLVRGPFGGSLRKDIFVESGDCVYEQGNVIDGDLENFRYFVTPEKFRQMKRFEVLVGDILMSCSGTIGKFVIIPRNFRKGIINQALLKITPNQKVIGEFLKFTLENYFSLNKSHVKGIAIKNIAAVKELKKVKIPLPSLKTQKQIVAKLSAVQEYKTQLLAQKSKLKELFNSALAKSFNG